MSKITKIDTVTRVTKHFVTQDGKQVEVRHNSTIDHYGDDVVIYQNTLKKGPKAGTPEYWVAVKDHVPSKRTAKADAILADALAGMSAKELQAKYGKAVQ